MERKRAGGFLGPPSKRQNRASPNESTTAPQAYGSPGPSTARRGFAPQSPPLATRVPIMPTAGSNSSQFGTPPATDHHRPAAGHFGPDARHSRPEAGHLRPAAGHFRSEAGHSRPESGHSRSEAEPRRPAPAFNAEQARPGNANLNASEFSAANLADAYDAAASDAPRRLLACGFDAAVEAIARTPAVQAAPFVVNAQRYENSSSASPGPSGGPSSNAQAAGPRANRSSTGPPGSSGTLGPSVTSSTAVNSGTLPLPQVGRCGSIEYKFTAEFLAVAELNAYRMVMTPLQEAVVWQETQGATRNVQFDGFTIVGMQPIPERPRCVEWFAVKQSDPRLVIRKPELLACQRREDGTIEELNLTAMGKAAIVERRRAERQREREVKALERALRAQQRRGDIEKQAAILTALGEKKTAERHHMPVPYRSVYSEVRDFRLVKFTEDGTGIHDSSDGNVSDGYSNAEATDEETYTADDLRLTSPTADRVHPLVEKTGGEGNDDADESDEASEEEEDGDDESEDLDGSSDDDESDDESTGVRTNRGTYVRELTPGETLRFEVRVPT